jgi:7-carboxy-7-deazaguanine synthase
VGCRWCDTKYTWESSGGRASTIAEAFAELRALGEASLLVVTGGEPLSHPGVERVLQAAVGQWSRVEVETSGLCAPPVTHERLHYMWSPKLPSVTERWLDTWAHTAAFVSDPRTTIKIVVGEHDEAALLERLSTLALPRERVMLMPEGMTDAALVERARALATLCLRENLRLSPRLHVWLWGAKRGV